MKSQRVGLNQASEAVPPSTWFGVSAVFHYLGPAFAVLLFPAIGVLGIAWFRIASASLVLGILANPVRVFLHADPPIRLLLVGLGMCLAAMNVAFYLALDRLPMSLVAAMEFVGTLALALFGARSVRNLMALLLAILGVLILIDVSLSSDWIGLAWSALNAILFTGYIALGHRAARHGASSGFERLSAAMTIALIAVTPFALAQAIEAFGSAKLVMAGIGVGICSSVIPYVCDQLAMSRLPRATFALYMAILPATATVIAAIVLAQIPNGADIAGITLVMAGIALHDPASSDR